jgi:hypothetical protein
MKKFSLRHNYSTIELVGPLEHLKISIDYGRNHEAVYREAYWFMRFLNKHWNFTLDSIKSQVLSAIPKNSNKSVEPSRAPVPVIPDPPFSTDVLDPDTYKKLLNHLESDLRDRFPQPSTKLRNAKQVRKDLGISQTTLWRWSKRGLLKTVKIYNSVYVDLASVADLESRARRGELEREPHWVTAAHKCD